jgi:hypothetical protein
MTTTFEPDYSLLLDLIADLIQSQAGKAIPSGEAWKNDAQVLGVKLHHHLLSMRVLASGSMLKTSYGSTPFTDHASIKVLVRAALETYLVFAHLASAPTPGEGHLRYLAWVIGGLMDRQRVHVITEEGIRVKASEGKQIETLRLELQGLQAFQRLDQKLQSKILKGEWRAGKSWADLGVEAGFHQIYFRNTYGYLCGYSHSSYISVVQVRDARLLEDQDMLTGIMMTVGMRIMALFVASYSRLFSSVSEILDRNKSALAMADKWHFTVADMDGIFKK